MPKSKRPRASTKTRVGKVGVYEHHGAWWIRFRERGRLVRRRVANDRDAALRVAAEVNAQLACAAPTLLSFSPTTVPALKQAFLDYHEGVLGSTVATVSRYRTALAHLDNFVSSFKRPQRAHEIRADEFAAYLRRLEVAPNGHPNARRRPLRDKGVQYVLETARALFNFAAKRRHLPPYAINPFAELPLDRLRVEDAKPIVLFDEADEIAFFRTADAWEFPLHYFLSKSGLRVGEATHLLIEDVDFNGGWVHVRNKPDLDWRVKTGAGRRVPLLPEVVAVLRRVITGRAGGVLFLRRRFAAIRPLLAGSQQELERDLTLRKHQAGGTPTRPQASRLARRVWRDAGAVPPALVRTSFMRVAARIGRPAATCPKSWRHGFATLLGEGNVDPQIRQIVMGHSLTAKTALGMTARYSHPSDATIRRQVENALRIRAAALAVGVEIGEGVSS